MTLPTIAQHAKLHGIEPSKKLGQNFLFDQSLCDKIAKSAGGVEGKVVLEIGPGPGGLTRAILSLKPQRLIVVEKDSRCVSLIGEIGALYPELELVQGDALNVKLKDIAERVTIIANLPYNIGTTLLFQWLDEIELVESITIMLQKEVVDRICAKEGGKTYGKLSVMCQLIANVEKLFDVSKEAFYPPPKVTSSIVRITPKKIIPTKEIIEKVRHITGLAFSARRKMIRSWLTPDILESLSIDPTLRAENLSVEDYERIAQLLSLARTAVS